MGGRRRGGKGAIYLVVFSCFLESIVLQSSENLRKWVAGIEVDVEGRSFAPCSVLKGWGLRCIAERVGAER